ncbi:hypothetical protein FRC17_007207 [Serendipita sp. 399]|nr:hypothetical protein FRC17_007207 [Serendipita sp. 399]
MSTLTLGIAVHLLVEERRPFFWARCLKLDPDANIVDSLAALVKLPAWVEADDLVFWELLAPVPYKDRLKLRDYRCPAAAKDKMTNISGSKSVGSLVQLEDSSMRVLVTNFYYPQLHFAFTDEPGSPPLSLRGSMIHPEMYLSNISSLICSTLSISPKDGVDLFKPSEPHPIKLSLGE